jgi:hypothetical protein
MDWEKCFRIGRDVSELGEVFKNWERSFRTGRCVSGLGEVFQNWESYFRIIPPLPVHYVTWRAVGFVVNLQVLYPSTTDASS